MERKLPVAVEDREERRELLLANIERMIRVATYLLDVPEATVRDFARRIEKEPVVSVDLTQRRALVLADVERMLRLVVSALEFGPLSEDFFRNLAMRMVEVPPEEAK